MLSRRDFHRLALAALPLSAGAAKPDSKIHGVQIGVQSYSFRDRSLDDAIKGMLAVGFTGFELYQGHIEPKVKREELSKWRPPSPWTFSKKSARSSTPPASI